jgi:hypothetical protein
MERKDFFIKYSYSDESGAERGEKPVRAAPVDVSEPSGQPRCFSSGPW